MLNVKKLHVKYSKRQKTHFLNIVVNIHSLLYFACKMHVYLLEKVSDCEMNSFLKSNRGLAGSMSECIL